MGGFRVSLDLDVGKCFFEKLFTVGMSMNNFFEVFLCIRPLLLLFIACCNFFFLQKSKCYVLERNVACVSRFLLEIHEIAFASFSPPASFPLNFCLSRNED